MNFYSYWYAVKTSLYPMIHKTLFFLFQVPMFGAGALILYRTKTMYTNIVQWWVACSLVSDCIAPIDQHFCDFQAGRWEEFANCHRFDQSVLNVLAANHFHFMPKTYTPFGTKALKVQHHVSNEFTPKKCSWPWQSSAILSIHLPRTPL